MPTVPVVAHTVAELEQALAELDQRTTAPLKAGQARRGVVMTMGALHAGHMELVDQARSRSQQVVVTIFVNPLQFGPGEDYDAYPRTLDQDVALLAEHGADVVFAPERTDMYPDGDPLIRVTSGELGTILEGAFRPGHFDGMLTVVNKLFRLTNPDQAFFGEKDAQQLMLITRMVTDFNLDVAICPVPIVRQKDGLALSSRNSYLSQNDRTTALTLVHSLYAARDAAAAGATAPEAQQAARDVFAAEPHVVLDYCVAVDPSTIVEASQEFVGEALVLVAARVGTTRLIDNMRINIGSHD